MSEVEPTLVELLRRAIESRVADIHVSLPGIVKSYDAAKQVCSVQPAVGRILFDDDADDDATNEMPPILENVPVEWPGAGGCYIHFPMAAGDTGTLVFCERSISEWRAQGVASIPGDLRVHGLGSAIFRPGLRPDTDARLDAPASGVAVISLGDNILRVGPTAGADWVALAAKVTAQLEALKTAIQGGVTVPNDGGASLKSTILAALSNWPEDVAATKLKTA